MNGSTAAQSPEEHEHFKGWPNDAGFHSTYTQPTPVELKVTGTIPSYAAGVLYRTGTGANEVDTDQGTKWKVSHWFDGFAVVHRFEILPPDDEHKSVRVLYNSRSTCDGMIENIRRTGRLENITFGRKYDPCMSFFKKVMSTFQPKGHSKDTRPDEVNTAITMTVNYPGLSKKGDSQHHGHASGVQTLCNKTDSTVLQFLDPKTLEPVGVAKQTKLHPDLKGPVSAAHARSDPKTGDIFNYNLELGRRPTYRIFRVAADTGRTSILATFEGDSAYIHSFCLTENYVILCVWNSFYVHNGLSILWNRNIIDAIADYNPSKPARWYVVDRRPPDEGGRGLIATYECPAFYCFHTVNAFEEASEDGKSVNIVADLITYDNLDVLKKMYLRNLVSTSPDVKEGQAIKINPVLRRFHLDSVPTTPTKKVLKATMDDPLSETYLELPTVNPMYVLRRHRYVYGVTVMDKSSFFDGLVKYDTQTGETITWSKHGQTAGEAIFVPRRRNSDAEPEPDEDDGVLLSVVLDGPAGKSYLLVLDPKTMTELGRAEVDGPVGFGFHGTHVPAHGGVAGTEGPEGRSLDF
ncbi:hypothetical protein VTN31DRAFT_1458 [Thermomyces dupontii]|uniref:uncharacterized protein n=1 Tax=Talaromyces thermophilus TaxID=28565 RepID=UPI00374441C4